MWRLTMYATLSASFAASDPGAFWHLTDVHLDLEGDCSGGADSMYASFDGQYGCGVSPAFLDAGASFMREELPTPDFVLFTGDSAWSGGILDTMEAIRDSVAAQFQDVPIYFTLGNHDFNSNPAGSEATAWYSKVADVWGDWLDDSARKELGRTGYYSFTPTASPSIRIVGLNTELFNHGNDAVVAGCCIEEALAHLQWLDDTLSSCADAKQRAYIIGHVPIGMETAYLNDRAVPSVVRPYWLDLFARRYQDIIDKYGESVVAVQILGHEHVDTFRLVGKSTVLLSAPSVSSGYPRSNPTLRLWRHDPGSGHVLDYDQYFMDLLKSNSERTPFFNHSYSFCSEYGMPDLTRSSFEKLLAIFQMERHEGQPGWECSDDSAAIFVPGRSVSDSDRSFSATGGECEQFCADTSGCEYWQFGHSKPRFEDGVTAWCWLFEHCKLVKDESAAQYEPKYAVTSAQNVTASLYQRERRFFLSSTPEEVQPECDQWCRIQDLCDKEHSAVTGSNMCFSQCADTGGLELLVSSASEATLQILV
eukprot:TRINITY_DN68033_c0_g1_i1.p1 TRINITY_DN68033_c0_g1~~TRINITY_DN68033_c0_g1_i1.p1  ORF type:complete len:534 (-),score=69.42 TRINITY_DN68033_c0_g1_i1:168-1769(-)